jgi:hypothetical protein
MEIVTKATGSKKKLIAFKIYFDRARMYLGYINFFMLNLVLINSFENETVNQLFFMILIIPYFIDCLE